MSTFRLLVTCGHLQRHIHRYKESLESEGIELYVPPLTAQQFSAAEMAQHIREIDVVIAGDDVIDASVLEAGKASRLKAIVKWGIGTDSIDKQTAAKIGIPVYNTPGAFSDEVADLAMSYILALARSTLWLDAQVRAGKWPRIEGTTLRGKTAGVIGLGGIGQAVSRRCCAFGMKVLGADVMTIDAQTAQTAGFQQVPLDNLLCASDFIVLACNLTKENYHLFNAKTFSRMKEGAYLVNVARGPLIDETALIDELRSRRLAGAGLDVFETEPLPANSPLHSFEHCIFGSHGGSSTKEAIDRINSLTIEIARHILGTKPGGVERFNRVA